MIRGRGISGTLILLMSVALTGCSDSTRDKAEATKAKAPVKPPDQYKATFETSKGNFVIEVHREWAPRGADRFYELIQDGFYNESRFHRVVRNFVVQWGINKDPAVSRLWSNLRILDDPPKQSNRKGTVAFAAAGPASRTTQVFINLRDNKQLDKNLFAPFGEVVSGMDVVESLYNSYGEMPPRGNGPDPSLIETRGNEYLETKFPRLDYIKRVSVN